MAEDIALLKIVQIYNSFFGLKGKPINPLSPSQSNSSPPIPPVGSNGTILSALEESKLPRQIVQTIPPPRSNNSNSLEAMRKAYFEVFTKKQDELGQCGKWVYNLAYRYNQAVKGKILTPGNAFVGSNNNARSQNLTNNLINEGYTVTKLGTNITKQELKDLITKHESTPGYGDILVYASNTPGGSEYLYGHAQIYVGSQIHNEDKSKLPQGKYKVYDSKDSKLKERSLTVSGWATSLRDNYGTNFVYNREQSDKWSIWLYRAPGS